MRTWPSALVPDIGSVDALSMISSLKRWSLNSFRASSAGISSRMNGCSSAMISRIRASIRSRSSGWNVPGVPSARGRQLEVVVEAVLDRRADAERGPGEQVEHSLGEDVGRRVADREQAPTRVRRHDRDLIPVGEGVHEVPFLAVDHGDHRRLAQALADLGRQLAGGGAGRDLALGTVRQRDRELVVHDRARLPTTLSVPEPRSGGEDRKPCHGVARPWHALWATARSTRGGRKMGIPLQQQVFDETDRRFHAQFSDAPERLDPHDPEHADWVREWGEFRVAVADEWTDDVFFEFFPIQRRLEPADPGDATYIHYWHDINTQLRGDAGSYDWSGTGPAPGWDQVGGTADTSADDGGYPAQYDETPHPDRNMDEAELVEQAFMNEHQIIENWKDALDNFESVMNSAGHDEAEPEFASAVLKVFAEKALGKFAEAMKAELVIDSLKAVVEEGERASEAQTSRALRDFVIEHRDHLTTLATLLTVDALRRAADARQKAEQLLNEDPDAYGMYRLFLMDLNDDTRRRLTEATPDALFQLLTEQWVSQTVTGQFVLRVDADDLAVRNIRLESTEGHKLLERLLKEDGGFDVWPMEVPKVFIYFRDGGAIGEVHVDEANRWATPPPADTREGRNIYQRLVDQGGPGRLTMRHYAED